MKKRQLSTWNNRLFIRKTSINTYDPEQPPLHTQTQPTHSHPSYGSVQLASEEVKGESPF